MVWDEALKVNGMDPDFHRRGPVGAPSTAGTSQWEFCLQTFTQEQAGRLRFRRAGPDQTHPEEVIPLRVVGPHGVSDRNPDNFFAETEQVAYCRQPRRAWRRLQQRPAAAR